MILYWVLVLESYRHLILTWLALNPYLCYGFIIVIALAFHLIECKDD